MKQGFTLIELLVVVLIIGVLSAIALPQYSTAIEKSRSAEALTTIGAIRQAVERYYYSHNDSWPSSWSDLDIDVPMVGSTAKGKYFSYYFSGSGTTASIVAKRDGLSAAETFALKTVLTDSGSTITAMRCCTTNTDNSSTCTAPTSGTKAETFCNAITGGHNIEE